MYTKMSDKIAYANSVDPDHNTVAIPVGISGNNCIKQNWTKKSMEQCAQNFRTFSLMKIRDTFAISVPNKMLPQWGDCNECPRPIR